MSLANQVLWNNEMTLAICLITELDEDEFKIAALETHLELTGAKLSIGECVTYNESMIRVLEVF